MPITVSYTKPRPGRPFGQFQAVDGANARRPGEPNGLKRYASPEDGTAEAKEKARHLAARRLELALQETESTPVDCHIPVERHATSETVAKTKRKLRRVVRREGEMRVALTAALEAAGHEVTGAALVHGKQTVKPDVIDLTTKRLYEIKATMNAEAIRSAIGQLAHEQFLYFKAFGVYLHKVIVLPTAPDEVWQTIFTTEAIAWEVQA